MSAAGDKMAVPGSSKALRNHLEKRGAEHSNSDCDRLEHRSEAVGGFGAASAAAKAEGLGVSFHSDAVFSPWRQRIVSGAYHAPQGSF